MTYQTDRLERGSSGAAVVELQLRLAGFRGTLWDGDCGGGTELQVQAFQRDFMGSSAPSGVVDAATVDNQEACFLGQRTTANAGSPPRASAHGVNG